MSTEADGPKAEGGVPTRIRVLAAALAVLGVAAWVLRDRGTGKSPVPEAPPRALPTRLAPEELSQAEADRAAPAVSTAYRREVERPRPVQNPPEPAPPAENAPAEPPPGTPLSRRRDDRKTLPEIFRMPPADQGPAAQVEPAVAARDAARTASRAPALDAFAPFGRLVKCQLVDTLDSVTARSEPIVALVTRDLDWNGSVIIPAGTEAFSYARPEPVIDAAGVGRLVDTGEWTLVLPGGQGGANGRELILSARAVDRRELQEDAKGDARAWGIDDGADGLVGYTLSTLDNEEIKLFAAAAVSGMAQGMAAVAQRQQPATGLAGALGATQLAPSVENAATGALGAGAAEAMNAVASRIRGELSRRGVYVRVPAGKEFYLFVEQTIDPRAAEVGLRLPAAGRLAR
jgi:hypothetical protein